MLAAVMQPLQQYIYDDVVNYAVRPAKFITTRSTKAIATSVTTLTTHRPTNQQIRLAQDFALPVGVFMNDIPHRLSFFP